MILGIMGGMGPAATIDFYEKLTDLSEANVDQDHLHILIDSNAKIPDRSAFICCRGQDPTFEMVRSLIRLEMMGANYIAIPCNTAHYFFDRIQPYTKAKMLNMIELTAQFLQNHNKEETKFVLFATKGTYVSNVYHEIFGKYNLNIVEPNEEDKEIIMGWIYMVKSGDFSMKASEVKRLLLKYCGVSKKPIILGCTELPLMIDMLKIKANHVNPVEILAKKCLEISRDQ